MDSLGSLKDKQPQFVVHQQSVGIGLQSFKQKFVFNQNSGPDAFYLDLHSPSPSFIQGMTIKQQHLCLFMMSEMLFKAGQMLKLPISTTIVALNIAQYYFTRKSLLDYDLRDIAMGAMFLACKSEETLRRSYQVAAVFDYLFKMYEGQRNIRELELNSHEYNYLKQKVTKTENEILFELGFEVSKLFDIPHRYISGLISSFNKHKQCNLIVQHSWTYLNDIYRTKAPVYYPGQVIASAAIFMALKKLNIPLPDRPWWILMETHLEQIKNVCALTYEMYDASNKNEININIVSQILEKVGKESLKVSNVLPLPYYRKIRLQNQGLLMKAIEQPTQRIENQKESSSLQVQQENDKSQKDHKQRSKKEKKKDKKKHKHHKNDHQNRSESQQTKKIIKKGQYQNDEQTPKIRNKTFEISAQLKSEELELEGIKGENMLNLMEIETLRVDAQISERKNSETNGINTKNEQVSLKKSVLFDAKSMLSKISQQIKKIQVKNQMVVITAKAQQSMISQTAKGEEKVLNSEMKDEKDEQNVSSSDEQDELMAELIRIKKKNLQKRQEQN